MTKMVLTLTMMTVKSRALKTTKCSPAVLVLTMILRMTMIAMMVIMMEPDG